MNVIQCRMSRIALGWGVRDLAKAAGLGVATVARFERGDTLRPDTVAALRETFEREGLVFIDADDSGGPGVRLAGAKPKRRSRKSG
jgi:transcriptional regulator with XRE-family HTH domain